VLGGGGDEEFLIDKVGGSYKCQALWRVGASKTISTLSSLCQLTRRHLSWLSVSSV
jgi:hypothetical protein